MVDKYRGFNSTLVQLKAIFITFCNNVKISFNSTLVQLKVISAKLQNPQPEVSILP